MDTHLAYVGDRKEMTHPSYHHPEAGSTFTDILLLCRRLLSFRRSHRYLCWLCGEHVHLTFRFASFGGPYHLLRPCVFLSFYSIAGGDANTPGREAGVDGYGHKA